MVEKMVEKLVRRYVYNTLYIEVMTWAKEQEIRAPNNINNFPFFLQKYVEQLKKW